MQEVLERLLSSNVDIMERNILLKLPFVAESPRLYNTCDGFVTVCARGFATGGNITQQWVAGHRHTIGRQSNTGMEQLSKTSTVGSRLAADGWGGGGGPRIPVVSVKDDGDLDRLIKEMDHPLTGVQMQYVPFFLPMYIYIYIYMYTCTHTHT